MSFSQILHKLKHVQSSAAATCTVTGVNTHMRIVCEGKFDLRCQYHNGQGAEDRPCQGEGDEVTDLVRVKGMR